MTRTNHRSELIKAIDNGYGYISIQHLKANYADIINPDLIIVLIDKKMLIDEDFWNSEEEYKNINDSAFITLGSIILYWITRE